MKEFNNRGCGKCIVLDERNGFMLMAAVERNEYIIAPAPIERDGSWTWGSYYKDIFDAVADYKTKIRKVGTDE